MFDRHRTMITMLSEIVERQLYTIEIIDDKLLLDYNLANQGPVP